MAPRPRPAGRPLDPGPDPDLHLGPGPDPDDGRAGTATADTAAAEIGPRDAARLPGSPLSGDPYAPGSLPLPRRFGVLSASARSGWSPTWTAALATFAATLLLVDAWFDLVTANRMARRMEATVSAVAIELPLALVCGPPTTPSGCGGAPIGRSGGDWPTRSRARTPGPERARRASPTRSMSRGRTPAERGRPH